MQSLCSTRRSARSTNLRIVVQCLPAVIKYLDTQRDANSVGLLKAINTVDFLFGMVFLNELFLFANTTSESLQARDTDLAAAVVAVEDLQGAVQNLRNNNAEFERIHATAANLCSRLGVECNEKPKRKRAVPSSLRDCVMDRYLTSASDGAVRELSDDDQLKQQLKMDFYYPVLDATAVSLSTRFGSKSTTILKHAACVLALKENYENSIGQLCAVAKLDAGLCVAQGKMLLSRAEYKPPNESKTLQCLASTMITLGHHVTYRHYFDLVIFLLTLPVTSATARWISLKLQSVQQ